MISMMRTASQMFDAIFVDMVASERARDRESGTLMQQQSKNHWFEYTRNKMEMKLEKKDLRDASMRNANTLKSSRFEWI